MKPGDSNSPPVVSPELKADYSWYSSVFTQLLVPLAATRYAWLAIEDINPFNFLGKPKPAGEGVVKPWKEVGIGRYVSRNFAALGMGVTFLGIIGSYSRNTLHDIKSLYAEAVGYELDKKAEDVSLGDIFMKSQNAALDTTRSAYLWRTLVRMGTAATFFIPWHKFRDFKSTAPKYDANANVGVGTIGAYLFSEGFVRRPSFFDIEQKMVSARIKHNDLNPYAGIQPQDIQSLLVLHRKHRHPNYQPPLGRTQSAQNDSVLATQIATLMNQTYGNAPATDKPHFTIGKFNFLIGFGMLDHFPASLGFVELASRSADVRAVKEAHAAIKKGEAAESVFLRYGIDMKISGQPVRELSISAAEQEYPAKPKTTLIGESPRSHRDFAQKQEMTQGLV